MQKNRDEMLELYLDENAFIAAVNYTAGRFNFSTRLIEKDFLCSLVLSHIYQNGSSKLTFKGGTALAKIHAGFYRLSEDLDFSLSIDQDATRTQRSTLARPFKKIINNIPNELSIFNITKPLSGSNGSRQYNAILTYESVITHTLDNILIDIVLREKHVQQTVISDANSLLVNQFTEKEMVSPLSVRSYSREETYAEKVRAALTREKSAIRDFFDIHYPIEHKWISLKDKALIA